MIVKLVLYVMQDDACAAVVDLHGVRLHNLRKKILIADDSLFVAYSEVCLFVCLYACMCVCVCVCVCMCVCVSHVLHVRRVCM